ncbi:unnamed protein product [Aphanomyces euteiches]
MKARSRRVHNEVAEKKRQEEQMRERKLLDYFVVKKRQEEQMRERKLLDYFVVHSATSGFHVFCWSSGA